MNEEELVPRVLSAAEKRAARRARVLQDSDSRLKMLKGQISTPKVSTDESSVTSVEKSLDEGVDDRLAHNLASVPPSPPNEQQAEIQIPTRVDPAQRRRDAAARRRKKEKVVQEMLSHKTKEVAALEPPQEIVGLHSATGSAPTSTNVVAEPTFSRHSTALKLRSLEEKLVLLVIVVAAVYASACMDLSSITASLVANDQLFVNYQDLMAKGVPIESLRQQIRREQVLPEMREKLELLLTQGPKMEAVGASAATSGSGWVPDMVDLGFFLTSLVARPPIVFCVFVVRLVVSTGAKSVHKLLDLPDVTNPQEKDLGFLVNMALSSRPALKEFLVTGRKSLDDVFVFVFALVVFVAIRAIWLS